MKLTPVEILRHLGLTVPEEGIEISAENYHYDVSALQLIGTTMSADLIPDAALHERHGALLGSRSELAHLDPGNTPTGADKSRSSLRLTLKHRYGLTT